MALVESFSGIRGIYGLELNRDVVKKYGYSYIEFIKKRNQNPKIVIGRDSRHSGEEISNLLKDVLNCEILDVGILPTPLIENAVRTTCSDGGIIITASHNEPEYNGFKFLDKDGALIRPKDSELIIKRFHEINIGDIQLSKNLKVKDYHMEAIQDYKKLLKTILKTDKIILDTKIIVDSNGGAGYISKEIFEDYSIKAIYLNNEIGKFKRLIEPKEESLKYLKEELEKNDAEFAAGFDCDADRVEILLKDGRIVTGNDILALISNEILSEKTELLKSIVVNDATSYLVKEMALKNNATFHEVEVGEINIVDEMDRLDSQIGGEGSNGGIIIPPSKCRDGILTILILMKIIEKYKKSLSELIYELPKYYYLKEKIRLKEEFSLLKPEIKRYYINQGYEILETGDISGGLKAIKNNSWIWFRQSKTEDKILRVISDSPFYEISNKLINEARELLNVK
ncbi:MAG: hypothetical protein WC867_01355 [Candidatus Pacearchaeota archaeon]|jgi:phosphomannomutase